MKRIRFILPDQNRFSGNFSTLVIPGLKLPHIGTCIMGEMLRRKGYDVQIIDEKITPLESSDVMDSDLIGISISTVTAVKGYQLAEYYRKKFKIPVVLGGVHASLNPEEAVHYGDYVIRNEGEQAILELVEALENNLSVDDILGLSYKDGEEIYHNSQRKFISDLDSLPYPNWTLIKGMMSYKITPFNFNVYPIQVTRGCPFNCTFCSVTPSFGKLCRHRSIESVVDELKTNKLESQNYVFFYDDNLVGNKPYLKDLLQAILDNDIKIYGWHSQMRADVAEDPELLNLMQETNCIIGTFGFESINPETLKSMKKDQDPDLIKHCIKSMHDHGIATNGFFVFGFENDTTETIRETVKFAQESLIDIAGFMPLMPFPGTVLFDEMKDKDVIFSKNWELYDVQHVVYYPEKMTPYELYSESLAAYPRFYNIKNKKMLSKRKSMNFWNEIFMKWSIRSHQVYQYEYMANRRYMRYLKSLPKKPNIEELRSGKYEYDPKKDTPLLHQVLKRKLPNRIMKSVFITPNRYKNLLKDTIIT
ncbi:MAG: radical SAM protein [Candidatus Lokiarchaeota archaeon]|nr:radical SAM protein [Candidatus Lokiarchaeota archaeon]